jgi:hypothetical protein
MADKYEAQRRWREKNRDKINLYYQNNKDKKKAYAEKNKERIKAYRKKRYEENKELLLKKRREYVEKNREEINRKQREARKNNPEHFRMLDKKSYYNNIENKRKQGKAYRERNKEKIALRDKLKFRKYYKTDPVFKMTNMLRVRVSSMMRKLKTNKQASTLDLLGISVEGFVKHLEKKFQKGMTLKNYGDWHIDHIIPCASFDLTKPSEQKKCFHYTNLQPLWARENLQKGARI